MPDRKHNPGQWLLANCFDKFSLRAEIDKMVIEGIIDEGDAYDYFNELGHQIELNNVYFSDGGY